MKIMFFTLSLRNGGAERVLSILSNEMSKKHVVSVVTVHNSPDHYKLNKNIKRIRIDKKERNDGAYIKNKFQKISVNRIKRLIKVLKLEKPDVVITFLPLPSLYVMLAKRLSKAVRKIPIILSERADPSREYHNKIIARLAKNLYRDADGFVFQTEDAKDFFKDSIKCKTTIIENPIDGSFMNRAMPKNRRKTVVSCGRLEKQKNFKLLMSAFSDVANQYPEHELEIYGEGSQRKELLVFAKDLGIEKKVHLMGRVDNLVERILDAGIFVLSSDYEGMPNALMEAMALGIPCISTDCPVGGSRAIIKDRYNGLLVKVNNKEQLTNAILNILSDDKLTFKLSKCGIKESKKYTINNIANKWEAFILNVTSK